MASLNCYKWECSLRSFKENEILIRVRVRWYTSQDSTPKAMQCKVFIVQGGYIKIVEHAEEHVVTGITLLVLGTIKSQACMQSEKLLSSACP